MMCFEWGQPLRGDSKLVRGLQCPHCGETPDHVTKDPKSHARYVVGFSEEIPCPSRQEEILGIILVECPLCFGQSWFHANMHGIEVYSHLCPNWPTKVEPVAI